MSLIQMSFSGAVLILVILAVRAAAMNRLPKHTFLLLWGIALVRLLVPFSIPSVFSVYSFINRNRNVEDIITESPMANLLPLEAGATVEHKMVQASETTFSIWEIVWGLGFAGVAIFFVISYIICLRKFNTSLPVSNIFTEKWLKEHSIRRTICVRQYGGISSPLTYGIFRPVILLPDTTDWKNEQQLEYVFLHEYVHIRRFDLVWKLICTAVVCIHWFNPFVWVMYIFFNRDLELACDEAVIYKLGKKTRSSYALMLIGMEEERVFSSLLYNNFSKNAVEERIEAIMKAKKFTKCSSILAVILVLSVMVMFTTSGCANETAEDAMAEAQGEMAITGAEQPDILDNEETGMVEDVIIINENMDTDRNDVTHADTDSEKDISTQNREVNKEKEMAQEAATGKSSNMNNNTGTDSNVAPQLVAEVNQEKEMAQEAATGKSRNINKNTGTDSNVAPQLVEAEKTRGTGKISATAIEGDAATTVELHPSTEWIWPTASTKVSSLFGERIHPVSGETRFNDHINIAGEKGDDVYASISGTVTETAFDSVYGNYIVISGGNNIRITYGHLDETLVSSGTQVSAGEKIGTVGQSGQATGSNLSFAVFVGDEAVDPMGYLE